MNTNNTSNPPFRIGQRVEYVNAVNGIIAAHAPSGVKKGDIHIMCDIFRGSEWGFPTDAWFISVEEYPGRGFNAKDWIPIEEAHERIRYVAVSETLRERAEEVVVESCNLS